MRLTAKPRQRSALVLSRDLLQRAQAHLTSRCFFLLLALTLMPTARAGADEQMTRIPDSTNRVVKIDSGLIAPTSVEITEPGSSVFFLNTTKDEQVGVEIRYGAKLGYCATGDMRMEADGTFRSDTKFGPKEFIVVCFPQPGEYPVTVRGLREHPAGLRSKIIVRGDGERFAAGTAQ